MLPSNKIFLAEHVIKKFRSRIEFWKTMAINQSTCFFGFEKKEKCCTPKYNYAIWDHFTLLFVASTTKKLYFELDFYIYQEFYQLYFAKCDAEKENGNIKLSHPKNCFAKLLKQSNYSIFKPWRDQCDMCVSHKAGNLSDQDCKNARKI